MRKGKGGMTLQPDRNDPVDDFNWQNFNDQVLSLEEQLQEKNLYIQKLEK